MKGKKVDSVFISEFISKCIQMNKTSSSDIVNIALQEVDDIDRKIKEVELLKIKRCKLQDVITSLRRDTKKINKDELDQIAFFDIKHRNIAEYICRQVLLGEFGISNINNIYFTNEDIAFTIKQLIQASVVRSSGKYLYIGDKHYNYIKFLESNNE
jgi:hypothetical protein